MINSTIKKKKSEKKINTNNKQLILNKVNTAFKRSIKEKIDMIGSRNSTFLYNNKKRQRLNSLKDKTHKVSIDMKSFGESFKTININLNSESNPLMISNLANISFRKCLQIRKKLRNIDKMNKEFDKEYSNTLNLNKEYKYNDIDIKEVDEEYEQRIKKEKNIRDANFKVESMKILNILFKKNDEELSFSDYKKNKKLNELKSNIDYICGVETRGQNGNNKNELNKIPHYSKQVKNPSFIREKTKNESFTPSVKYNKSKVYYSKKYELSQEKIDRNKKIFQKINKTVHTSPNKKIKYKIKGINVNIKTEKENKTPKYNIISPIKNNNEEIIYKDKTENSFFGDNYINFKKNNNINNDKIFNKLPEIKLKQKKQNVFRTMPNLVTFSPKQKNSSYKQNLIFQKKYNSLKKDNNYRCKTANNISHSKININEKSINLSNKKKFFPLLKILLKDNYKLKRDLKLGFNIISNMINDFKTYPKKKALKKEINLTKFRIDLKLYNLCDIINEIDVVMNNVKKMEKYVNKKNIHFLRKVAKTVIREDILANKDLIFNNNNINAKLKKIYERKNKTNNQNEIYVNLDEKERIEMIKLFKNDGSDYYNEEYLSNLIKRYKTLKIK